MPPMPSAKETIQPLLSSLPRRIADLQTFQLPRLEKCLGPADLHRELVEEMRGDLEGVRYNIEAAREMCESLTYTEKQSITPQLDQLEREYQDLRRAYRSATLSSKRAMAAKRSRIHELASTSSTRYELDESRLADDNTNAETGKASGSGSKGKARSAAEFGMGGDDELQTKTNEVTTALRRTTALMQTELERSVLSVQMLESSSQTLLSTQSLYNRYTSLLSTSTKLVRTLEKADTLDRILILSALMFFLLVVGFIVKRRVIDRTVGVVVGGVGRGVGWYLWSSGRLIKLAFGRGRGGEKAISPAGKSGLGDKSPDSGIEISVGANTRSGAPLPQIGQDSAINPQSLPKEKDNVRVEHVFAPDPAPATTPYLEQGMENLARDNRGKVEIIAYDEDGTERIVPFVGVGSGGDDLGVVTDETGRKRDEL
ncbi:hypothetical protein CI109_103487 [Kwoniella shandongensis]|uniref:Sec20 C-terminal domain-containing protein n=1 Tax=Kwoniella shandongensis TaxID=1734106 RepID=A0A5M6C0F0_9TREE|nr:uncharacterized protein CI109_004610 [Kwoniella shandongensis]KAA5527075.1 hypothetical protein CI109_004610 [Kwoniella shandongensis]